MASKDDIKKAILKVAGNPVSGAIASLADDMAEAVFVLDNSSAETPNRVKPVRGHRSAERERNPRI